MELRESSTMRELSNDELGLVGGGLAPITINLGIVGDVVGNAVGALGGLLNTLLGGLTSVVGGLLGGLGGTLGGIGGL